MASVASSGTSPLAALDAFQGGDYMPADDESWAFISPGGLAPSSSGSIDFFPSPDTGSLRSYGIINRAGSHGAVQPSPPAPSPLFLDTDSSSSHGFAAMSGISAVADQGSFASSHGHKQQQQRQHSESLSPAFGGDQSATFSDDPNQSLFEQLAFADQMVTFPSTAGPADGQMAGVTAGENLYHGRPFRSDQFVLGDHDIQGLDVTQFMHDAWSAGLSPQTLPATGIVPPVAMNPQAPVSLDIPMTMRQQSDANAAPWNPSAVMHTANSASNPIFQMEEFGPQSARTPVTPTSTSSPAACSSASPVSPLAKQEPEAKPTGDAAIRKVKNARVEKRRSPADSTGSLASSIGSSSGPSGAVSATGEVALKFITISSESAAASGGKGNMFEGYDRMTQRGRKGPLANATKESALKVRRIGACFSCHARKVKCEATRPCRSCAKITLPQIICWQFTDFTTVLFPYMMREHFVKEKMAAFVAENVRDFRWEGAEQVCVVELTAGKRFTTFLTINAKAFTPNTPDILSHYQQTQEANGTVALSCGVAVPLGLDMAGDGGAQRADLQKRAKDFVGNLIRDPRFADEVTAEIRSTSLPRDVLRIVCRYAARTKSEIVEKALRVYTNHYILSRHLTITPKGLSQLMRMRLASRNHESQTTRLLNRQFKAVLDEIHKQEMSELFNLFAKLLKPKMRKEWAPCMAAFLILTLFMEDLEITIDVFGCAQNQIDKDRERLPSEAFKRSHMIAMNREIEHMPFRQFAYQFHQIYQTHSTDASTKPFNPLVDASLLDEQNLDPAAMEMVRGLRDMMDDYDSASELDFLSGLGSELDNSGASHPYPMDVSNIYSGRLMAKFILSFNSIQHLLDP